MALPAAFLDELRARTAMPALVGRKVRLTRAGRQYKGCCPFHGEKTPSFYVYEDGFHCFGCGAHGDAISFVMQTEGATFPEAVQRLAAEAGLEVPAPTPEAAAAERRRVDIYAVLDLAQQAFRTALATSEGERGREYLRSRALDDAAIEAHGLGYAPGGRGALLATLREAGVTAPQMVEAGVATEGEGGLRAMFFDRVTFPIRDAKGRIISFGARTMGDAQPKYLNGPETPVFRKRHGLYGLHLAREAARQDKPVIVVEGYMDVLRLQLAGFGGAVAPLGTAVTEEQLALLWSLAEAPVLCFDGDKAGGRAAVRALDLALPRLQPDRTLKFAALPAGDDPDSLTRRSGRAGMQEVLDRAATLADTLFAHLNEATPGDGPERRALLHRRLEESAARIPDRVLAREMRQALLQRFFARARKGAPAVAQAALRQGVSGTPAVERARLLTAILLHHPGLLHDVEEAYALVELPASLASVREAMHGWAATDPAPLDSASLAAHLTQVGLGHEAQEALADLPLPSSAVPGAQPAEAEACWWHYFNLLDLGRLGAQVEQARSDFATDPTEDNQRRLVALAGAHEKMRSGGIDDYAT